MAVTWEVVLMDGGHRFERLAVPSGWIYRDARIGAMCFVPLPPMTLAELPGVPGWPEEKIKEYEKSNG